MVPKLLANIKLSRLTRSDRMWLHFQGALAIMLWSPMWSSPTLQNSLTGQILIAWVIITAIGFCFSAVGLVLGAQNEDLRHKGFRIEMVGLWLMIAGPLVFLAVQAVLLATGGRGSWLGMMFPYVIIAAILCRMAIIKEAMRTVLYRFPREDEEDDV